MYLPLLLSISLTFYRMGSRGPTVGPNMVKLD